MAHVTLSIARNMARANMLFAGLTGFNKKDQIKKLHARFKAEQRDQRARAKYQKSVRSQYAVPRVARSQRAA